MIIPSVVCSQCIASVSQWLGAYCHGDIDECSVSPLFLRTGKVIAAIAFKEG